MVFCIVVTFNAEKWIEQCLASLFASSVAVNVVVVDNASTDETAAIVGRFAEVVYLPLAENIGFGRANNIGIAHALQAEADYVFLINQDAYVYPDTLEILLDCAKQASTFGILSPVHLNGDASAIDPEFLEYIATRPARAFLSDLYLHKQPEAVYATTYVNAAAWLLPCAFLREVGGFDPLFFLYGEDDDFVRRALVRGYQIGLVPSACICHYRQHSSPSGSVRRARWRAKINRHTSVIIFRLKDPTRNLAVCSVRLVFYMFIQSITYASRRHFDEIAALWIAYLRSFFKLPRIQHHRRVSVTRGTHWIGREISTMKG